MWFIGTVKITQPPQEFLPGSAIYLQNASLESS